MPLEKWHVCEIMENLQADQTWGLDYMGNTQYADDLIEAGDAFAMVRRTTNIIGATSEVLGCAGVWHINDHRAIAWGLVNQCIGSCFFKFHKAVLKFLNECPYGRVEMDADPSFQPAIRWAEMLGFERECTMKSFHPDGGDAYLYARVR